MIGGMCCWHFTTIMIPFELMAEPLEQTTLNNLTDDLGWEIDQGEDFLAFQYFGVNWKGKEGMDLGFTRPDANTLR